MDYVLDPEVLGVQRILIAEATHLPELARTYYQHGPRQGLLTLAAYLERMAAEGRLTVGDAIRSAEAFFGLIEGEAVRRAMLLGVTATKHERDDRLLRRPILKAHDAGIAKS